MDKSRRLTDHHMLFYDREWSMRPEGHFLRTSRGLIRRLPRYEHDIVHREVSLIPLLGAHALQQVANSVDFNGNYHHDIDEMITRVERAAKHPKADEIERALTELTARALVWERDVISGL